MKKLLAAVLTASFIFSVGATEALAYGMGRGINYVDSNGDGICDNYGSGMGRGINYVDEDGDGICDNYGSGMGRGINYVDKDGDGICDNCVYGTCMNGIGGGNGFRGGRNS